VLLVFGPPCQLRLLAGPEHGRTIPLAEMELRRTRAQLQATRYVLASSVAAAVSAMASAVAAGIACYLAFYGGH
jgi:hypothetical protein